MRRSRLLVLVGVLIAASGAAVFATLAIPAREASAARDPRQEPPMVKLVTAARVSGVRKAGGGAFVATIVRDDGAEDVSAERIVVAVGVKGNVETLGLDGLGVKGKGSHTPDERVDLRSIEPATERAALLIYRLTHQR